MCISEDMISAAIEQGMGAVVSIIANGMPTLNDKAVLRLKTKIHHNTKKQSQAILLFESKARA